MTPRTIEVNFDGLVGPTHNYAGLAHGNLASQEHRLSVSNPRGAALEGLAKMKYLADLGLLQAVLPPHHRPDLRLLRRLGWGGSEPDLIAKANRDAPQMLAASFSASSMWAANAATVCPSADAADGRVHFTPANLVNELHRSIEPPTTSVVLRRIFADEQYFVHHDPLPPTANMRDEGAANHMRVCRNHGEPGIQLFVYGASASDKTLPQSQRFTARQSLAASRAVARLHQIDSDRTFFVQQNPSAVDAGVFHNDVIAVANRTIIMYHPEAFVDTVSSIDALRRRFEKICGAQLSAVEVGPPISLADSVQTYLFNSQLISLSDERTVLICPEECRGHVRVGPRLEALGSNSGPIDEIHYVNVRQSMKNGGGPACLRLRVVLTDTQIARAHQGVFLTDSLYERLVRWVKQHYRDRLHADDLADPKLAEESHTALNELTDTLQLGSLYPFQR